MEFHPDIHTDIHPDIHTNIHTDIHSFRATEWKWRGSVEKFSRRTKYYYIKIYILFGRPKKISTERTSQAITQLVRMQP